MTEFGRTCDTQASDLHRLRLIGELERVPGNLLALPRVDWFDRIQQRVAFSWVKNRQLFRDFVGEHVARGRSLQLWHELAALQQRVAHCYWFISPLLQPEFYWRESPDDLSDYVVCEKRFVELKQLYVDAFETTCRLSTIAVALEAIVFHESLDLPTRKGSISVWQYDALPNAQKASHLNKCVVADLFAPYMDTALRNGIGHNTARYAARTDEVVWVSRSGRQHVEKRLGYTSFCQSVFEVVSTLLHVQEYFFATHVRAEEMPC